MYVYIYTYIYILNILNKSGHKTNPLGTPENNISHALTAKSTFALCLSLVR